MSAAEGITTRLYVGKWVAHCGCGGYYSGLKDTEAEAVKWVEAGIAEGNCKCAADPERSNR